MRRGLEKRLARVHAPVGWRERSERLRRIACCARVLMGDLVAECFAEWGIDDERAPGLRVADEAAAALAKLAGRDEYDDAVAETFAADFKTAMVFLVADEGMRRHYPERYWRDPAAEPDFERAALLDIFAWCLARKCGDALFGDAPERSTAG